MSVPKFFEFFKPTLEVLSGVDQMKVEKIGEALAEKMHLSDEDMAEMLPSRRQLTYKNRIHWSIQYLKNAELLERVAHGTYRITEAGKKTLATVDSIDLAYLESIPSFYAFHHGERPVIVDPVQTETPNEIIEKAYQTINDQLAKSLLDAVLKASPDFFEKLVVDLLLAMGYGYDEAAGFVTGRTGDGGIDGIINEDKLGFGQVYVQAKRWNPAHQVGSPEVHSFIGALMERGASKGLFITTSHFSDPAKDVAIAIRASGIKLILVDGFELTKLMIEYGVGVSAQTTYTIRNIDNDYFEE